MSDFLELKKNLLAEQVQEQLYQYIMTLPDAVGSKLPNEFELGKRFGVGRSTIREAVKLLSSRGILEVKRGSGTYVVRLTPIDQDPLGLQQIKNKVKLAMDLADVRLLLEPGIAELAAIHATQEELILLGRLCREVEQKIEAKEDHTEADIAFHTAIARCSGNTVVEQLMPMIDTAVMTFVQVTHKQLIQETIKTHRAILDAITERDVIGARTAMEMHLIFNRNKIKEEFGKIK